MKKPGKQTILALFTFIALLIILAVQVNWVFKSARLEERQFNLTINNALSEARRAIGETAQECPDMQNYLCGNQCKEHIREEKIAEIDSIIHSNLEIQNIDLDYTFQITDTTINYSSRLFGNKCYLKSLNGLLEKDNIKIRLEFPDRNQFLLAQIRGVFLLAFISLVFVAVSFFVTLRMFRKEQMMVEQTSDFINNMVHEFQTPLSNIHLAASMVKKKTAELEDRKVDEYISVIKKENERLKINVEKILKVSSNQFNNEAYETLKINDLVKNVCNTFQHRIDALGGKINIQLNARHSKIKGSYEHFNIILSNLIDNALKYSKGKPVISITTKNNKNNITLTIEDNGIGIDKKYHDKIFEKYFRISTGDIHNVKGFGIGLTLVKKMVEKYNGTITVSGFKKQGTIFTIVLPLKNEADKDTTC
jgi:two-component system phosphate regulon sensor histidine kinase PhoR